MCILEADERGEPTFEGALVGLESLLMGRNRSKNTGEGSFSRALAAPPTNPTTIAPRPAHAPTPVRATPPRPGALSRVHLCFESVYVRARGMGRWRRPIVLLLLPSSTAARRRSLPIPPTPRNPSPDMPPPSPAAAAIRDFPSPPPPISPGDRRAHVDRAGRTPRAHKSQVHYAHGEGSGEGAAVPPTAACF
jgi:hypothetical protein